MKGGQMQGGWNQLTMRQESTCDSESTKVTMTDPSPTEDMSRPDTRPPPTRYKSSQQLIKERLGRLKEEIYKASTQHLHQRPQRKPYHPFVWNSLGPYRGTHEIDYLITMSSWDDPEGKPRKTGMVS
ncbi:uncharacterized protein LOC134439003 isoform X2 [Engraulis encrasicolus]|uniref:uncharacterized protein LOC134439003 isoform X2 n=1 Tax=Engraulis encrasicolus TaxID=184585 RepID=UPI002FD318BE